MVIYWCMMFCQWTHCSRFIVTRLSVDSLVMLCCVCYTDTTSLRMSTRLEELSWKSELEGFNYRVSHKDELSPEVQRVYDLIMAKVQSTLSNLTQEAVQYGVNIIKLRYAGLTESAYCKTGV